MINATPVFRFFQTSGRLLFLFVGFPLVLFPLAPWAIQAANLDISDSAVLVRSGEIPLPEQSASEILIEEIEKRTGIQLEKTTHWPKDGKTVIVVMSGSDTAIDGKAVPRRTGADLPETRPEGFRVVVEQNPSGSPVLWILGGNPRGSIFGVGYLLRKLIWSQGSALIPEDLDIATSPAYPIRGHQLGYRSTSNSYDAWTPKVYDQYIRELALFGTNCIENIPFQDNKPSPNMPIRRERMNIELGKICEKYDIDYWVWTPAVFPLTNEASREALIARHVAFYKKTPRLDGVFFPGGDPGDNPPQLVLPFLKDLSVELAKYHPKAGIWLSLQGFDETATDYVYSFLQENHPAWIRGLVAGPSSPPLPEMRKRTPRQYRIRQYPDITHTVRCQYPVKWWDPAFSLTLGREPINPQPEYYSLLCNYFSRFTDGFLSYSDGVNDDVNKVVWSRSGWDPGTPVRNILIDYARFFFGPEVAESAADGILALEGNWEGSLADNGSVSATLSEWRRLAELDKSRESNWRWVSCLFRAYYDDYTRQRLIFEENLEQKANQALAEASKIGADRAMDEALGILNSTGLPDDLRKERDEIFRLGDRLNKLIGMQLSVKQYKASGAERGCTLQFIDHPLNNRWWLEDEFAKIRKYDSEEKKLSRLRLLRTWENPGPGNFYDDLGNIAKSPHVIRGKGLNTDPLMERDPNPGYWWWDSGESRRRLSWQVSMDAIIGMKYVALDPQGTYLVRITGQRESLLKIDGERVKPTKYSLKIGEFKEFPVPKKALEDGELLLTWDWPDESDLNWRYTSHLSEVWLLKQ